MRFTLKSKFIRRFSFSKNDIIISGKLSKYRNWELQIDKDLAIENDISFSICFYKRLFADLVSTIEINLGKFFWSAFVVNDTRIWDNHTDKAIPYDEYIKLSEKREGKPKYKERRLNKEKWYYSSKFLKLYNTNFLNDPYGIIIDFACFPIPIYFSLQIGNHLRHKFCLGFNINKTPKGFVCETELCLFGYFIEFQIGENTVIRNANVKYIEDFNRLSSKASISDIKALLEKQIERKNLEYVKAIVHSNCAFKYQEDSDEFLILASYEDTFKKEIFDFLFANTQYFNSFAKIEEYIEFYNPYAVEKLKTISSKNNKI